MCRSRLRSLLDAVQQRLVHSDGWAPQGGYHAAAMHRLSRHAAALRRSAPELRPAAAADEEVAEDARTPVCLVIGAGAGIGQGVATKFAAEGYHACVVRRGGGPSSLSDDSTPGKFEEFVQGLRDAGGEATAFFANG